MPRRSSQKHKPPRTDPGAVIIIEKGAPITQERMRLFAIGHVITPHIKIAQRQRKEMTKRLCSFISTNIIETRLLGHQLVPRTKTIKPPTNPPTQQKHQVSILRRNHKAN